MLVDLLWSIYHGVAVIVFALLPTFDLSSLVASVTAGGQALGGMLVLADYYVPMHEIVAFAVPIAALMPTLLAYRVFTWVWRHVPTIAGFGLGEG